MRVVQLAKLQEFANSFNPSDYSLQVNLLELLLEEAYDNSEEAYVTDSIIAEAVNSHEDVNDEVIACELITRLANIDYSDILHNEIEFQFQEGDVVAVLD